MKKGTLAALLVTLVVLSVSPATVFAMKLPPGFVAAGGHLSEQASDAIEDHKPETPDVELPEIDMVTFIHYAKPEGTPGKGPGNTNEGKGGYKLLRGGVKWADEDLPVSYSINATGYEGGFDAIVSAFETWDAEVVDTELFDNTVEITDRIGTLRDDNNTVSWANLEDERIIAQCTIWFYVNTKEIIEFDIVLNTQQPWGIDEDGEGTDFVLTNAFDIQNIATHESGHTLHLGDLYEDKYSEMTMYGYAGIGEVKKRSLEWGDKNGVHKLYGA